MNILDIIILIPVAWMAYRGFSKGLIIEVATLVALILGIYLSINFSYIVGNFLVEQFDLTTKYLHIIAFIVTFIGVVLIVHLIGKILEKVVNIVALGFINKLLGGVFGILKAVIFLSVIIMLINRFDPNQNLITDEKRDSSMFYEHVESVVPSILPFIDLEKIQESIPKFDGEKDNLEI